MGGDHKGAISPLAEQLFIALLLEARVADGHQFIDKIAVKLDGQRKAKCKARAHAGRIMFRRLLQRRSQFRKLIHPGQGVSIVLLIEAREKADIIQSGQTALEPPSETYRPRRRHAPIDVSLGGRKYAAQHLDQGGLALPVSSQNREPAATLQREVETAEQGLSRMAIGLGKTRNPEADRIEGGKNGRHSWRCSLRPAQSRRPRRNTIRLLRKTIRIARRRSGWVGLSGRLGSTIRSR
ncbi:hypothetical protein D3C85_1109750 [compost metagenome]